MFVRNSFFLTLLISNFIQPVLANTQAPVAHNSMADECAEPIARVMNGNDLIKTQGSLVCPNDLINPQKGKKVQILCYLNNQMLKLGKGPVDDDPNKCAEISLSIGSGSCIDNLKQCPKPKKQNTNKKLPKIITPFGYSILDLRPSISWKPVSGATSYIVVLDGNGVQWSKETKNTALPYPEDAPPLENGSVYSVDVIAKHNGVLTNYDSTILIVLRNNKVQEIKKNIQIIKSLKLSPDEEARDLDAIYMSANLLNKSIRLLEQRISAGSTDPIIHDLLRKRYKKAELPGKNSPKSEI